MLQRVNQGYSRDLWEDRSDAKKWAWPGQMTEIWSIDNPEGVFMTFFGPDTTLEEVQETRAETNVGMRILVKGLMTEEYRNATEVVDVRAKGCPKEPDAPEIDIRITFPKEREAGEKLPVLLLFYAAGYQLEPRIYDVEAAHYAKDLHCAVVVPSYRPYPDDMYPAQVNDGHAAYQWILDHADEYGLDADRVVLTGGSFGGLMSVAVAHRLKDCQVKPSPRGVVAIAPVIDDREVGQSGRFYWSDNGQPSPAAYHLCWEGYVGYGNAGCTAIPAEAFPNHATVEEVVGMPPMAMHINESDTQRDAEIEYCRKLLDANVFCSMHEWGGTRHAFNNATRLCLSEDPFMKRVAGEIYADIRGFFDYDFRRQD